MKMNETLISFVERVVGLNANISPILLNHIIQPVQPTPFISSADPFLSYTSNSLFDSQKFYQFTKKSDISIFLGGDTPRTIKELLVVAASNKKNYWFFRSPIKVLTDFLLSIKNEQLVELDSLNKELLYLRSASACNSSVFRLKVLLDNFVCELVSSSIEFSKAMPDAELSLFLFQRLQSRTLVFIEGVDALLQEYGNDEFYGFWGDVRHLFSDFSEYSDFGGSVLNVAKIES